VNSLVEALVTALDGNRTQVNAVVADLKTVLDTLAARKDTVQQLVSDYATVTGTIAKRDLEIQTMVDNLVALTGTFADSSQTLDNALVQLPELATGLQTLLSANEQQLGSTIDSLAQVSDTVHLHLADITTILEQFPAAQQALFRATSYGEFILINAVCISSTAPPCPTPIILAANAEGSGPLDSSATITDALLGGLDPSAAVGSP
jgi:phospholipid/cholesterol/gamma-HCH transport system substrate-binding protein